VTTNQPALLVRGSFQKKITNHTLVRQLAVLFLLALIALGSTNDQVHAQSRFEKDKLTLVTANSQYIFEIELAKTPAQQSQGLMFRRVIGDNEGMLFIHPEPKFVTMWMRNTYIPLDMLFIRSDGRIHRIESQTEPLSERIIDSGERVTAVLEIAGGLANKLQIKPGDLVRYSHFIQ